MPRTGRVPTSVGVWLRIAVGAGCVTAAILEVSDGVQDWDYATIPMLILACIVLSIDACLMRVRSAIEQANTRVAQQGPRSCSCHTAANKG